MAHQRWVVSDTHFGHENIIKYASRPFADAKEMDRFMIEAWNERVKPQDSIYHLGDVTMLRDGPGVGLMRYMSCLNGHKRLLLGNHDHFKMKHYMEWFEEIWGTWRIERRVILSHIPIHPLSLPKGVVNVHGHIHEQPSFGDKWVNVCVEQTGYAPIAWEDVMERAKKGMEE